MTISTMLARSLLVLVLATVCVTYTTYGLKREDVQDQDEDTISLRLNRRIDENKNSRFERWLERHQERLQARRRQREVEEDTGGAETVNDDDTQQALIDPQVDVANLSDAWQISMWLTGEKRGKKHINYQHNVVRRDTESQFQHTVVSGGYSGLELVLVERTDGHRKKRAARYMTSESWPHDIPYVIDDSFSSVSNGFYVNIFHRVARWVNQHTCITYHDETDKYDPSKPNWFLDNGYQVNSYLLIKKGTGCTASSGAKDGNSAISLFPCFGFQIMLHELLHTIGSAHVQQIPIRDNYITINPDNVDPSLLFTYDAQSIDSYHSEYFDAASTLLYGPRTWTRNGLEAYSPIREDLFQTDSAISSEEIIFKELTTVLKCNEKFCNNVTIDCGLGYYGYRNKKCGCVCPRFYDPDTNCHTLIKQSSDISWPDVPLVVFKAGNNTPCPTGFDQQHGGFTHTGIWPDLQMPLPDRYEAVDRTTYFQMCSKPGPSTPDWELMPPGGAYCIIKPQNASCGFGDPAVLKFESLDSVEYYGNIGDTTIAGNAITMKMCCSYQAHYDMVLDLPNADAFRVVAKGACPIIRGMRTYKALVDFYIEEPKSVTGGVLPQYYIFAKELQIYHCYFQPPVYGCHKEITLDNNTRTINIATPGYDVNIREPDRRCFYIFNAPEGAQLRLTFHDYDLHTDDKVLIQRDNAWQEPYRVENDNYPYQILSTFNHLHIEYWAGYLNVANKGVNLTVDVLLGEEACYSVSQKGANYVGDTSISETYEVCLPWVEATECHDFPFSLQDSIWLLTAENYCRNPNGDLLGPWCYTYKNGTNCQKRYCDVCNYKEEIDVIKTCADLMANDPDFCTDRFQRHGCFKSCGYQREMHSECPEGWTVYKGKCVRYFESLATKREAEVVCRGYHSGGRLFEVLGTEDQEMLEEFVTFHGIGTGMWISGEYNGNTGSWQTSDDSIDMTFLNFNSYPECPESWEPMDRRCIKEFVNEKLTASLSETACAEYGSTGTLFRAHNEDELLAIREFKNMKGNEYIAGTWIGGHLTAVIPNAVIGNWSFTGGAKTEVMTYFNWTQFEEFSWLRGGWRAMMCDPSGGTAYYICQQDKPASLGGTECVYMMSSGIWDIETCDLYKLPYMCQMHKEAACATPTIPADGHPVEELKSIYAEGERVKISCNYDYSEPAVNAIICQGGEWTQLNYVCTQCPTSWIPYGDRCLRIMTDTKMTADDAAEFCRSQGPSGTLLQIHNQGEQMNIEELRQGMGSPYNDDVWISGTFNNVTSEWRFTDASDSTLMVYFNWNLNYPITRSCVKMHSQKDSALADTWQVDDCTTEGTESYFICQLDKHDVGCADKINDCEIIIESFPDFCTNMASIDMAEEYCYKSCGLCDENNVCNETTSSTYYRTSPLATVEPGDIMTFACASGLYHVDGDLERTCSSSGGLLGAEPLCSGTPVAKDVNINSVRKRLDTLTRYFAYLLDHDGYRVPFDGSITRWYYLSDTPRVFFALVYRNNGTNYNYIGANMISADADWPWSYKVPAANQISVLKDDIVGFYSPNADTLMVNTCGSAMEKLLVNPRAYATNFNNLMTASFSQSECLIPSFGFRVEPS